MIKITQFILLSLLTSGLLGCGGMSTLTPDGHMKLYVTDGNFDFVKEDLVIAITNRGMVINNTSYIGKMLDRTGKDLGATRKVYLHAQALEFCSADISRRTMEADPTNIVFCPYIITVYTLPEAPSKVYVVYRRPQPVGDAASQNALKAVEALLDGIVREALNLK